jgi:hypothetical protein
MKVTKTQLQNLSILIFITVICLILAEYSLRILFPIYPTIYQPDETLLHKLIPGSKKIYTHSTGNGGKKISVEINSLGFRGEEFSPYRTKKRVVIYGDSFIEGEFSSLEMTFAKQLERSLINELGEDLEVINAGVVAYGPDQVSLRMEQELGWLEADLIIVSVFADNDYGDLIRNKIYRLDDSGGLVKNNYYLDDDLVKSLTDARQPKELKGSRLVSMLKLGGSRIASMLNTLAKQGDDSASSDLLPIRIAKRIYWRIHDLMASKSPIIQINYSWTSGFLLSIKKSFEEYVVHGNNVVHDMHGDRYDADIAVEPNSRSSIYKVKLMEQVLRRISNIATNNRSNLLLLTVPSPIDVCQNYDYQIDKSEYPDYDPSRLTSLLEKAAVKHDIDFYNLYTPFRLRNDADTLYFRYGNDHWNDKGQAIAARLVTQKIISEGYLNNDNLDRY